MGGRDTMPRDRDATMTGTEPWTCPTCNTAVSTPYCPGCGERPLRERELTLRGIFNQLVQVFTKIDGRLILSFRCLVSRPGFLTVAYLHGQRKPYVGPVPLFLIANARVLRNRINDRRDGLYDAARLTSAHATVESRRRNVGVASISGDADDAWYLCASVRSRHGAECAVAHHIHGAVFVAAPSLAFYRSRSPLGAHAFFSFHVDAFLLLLFSVATAVPPIYLWFGGAGSNSSRLDDAISIALLLVCGMYLYVATGKVCGATGVSRVLKVVALTVAVASIVLGYRFVLFVITLYTT